MVLMVFIVLIVLYRSSFLLSLLLPLLVFFCVHGFSGHWRFVVAEVGGFVRVNLSMPVGGGGGGGGGGGKDPASSCFSSVLSSSLLLSSLELSDNKVCEPSIRALLGTALRCCTAVRSV